MTRFIAHFDLDAFYASVEELDHPEYAGHPLVVGSDPEEGRARGVVATANYEARRYGIRSAMPISEAWRRCPAANYVRPRMERYEEKSEEVFAVLRAMCDAVEAAGIDEGYLDLTSRVADFGAAVAFAGAIQKRVRSQTGLSSSLGVSTSKTVAKIATDMRKPFGLTPVAPGMEEDFLAPLPVRKIPGVGPKSEERLAELGIATCAELAAAPVALLSREFGVWGPRLSKLARGIDEAPVETVWQRKSLGGETTFPRDAADPRLWRATVEELAREAAASLAAEGLLARTLTLKVRLVGFETFTRARTLPRPSDDARALSHLALELLEENRPSRAVRLLGVRASGLVKRESQSDLSLWSADFFGESEAWRPAQRRLDEV